MRWSALRLRSNSVLRAVAVVGLALLVADCARQRGAQDPRRPRAPTTAATAAGAATLVPPDLALAFLQEIKPGAGDAPCKFTDKGTWSAGEYRRITMMKAATQIVGYPNWILYKIEDAGGRDFTPADLSGSDAWVYSLRTPRTARTAVGAHDQCVVGPTDEPVKKVVEALTALGIGVARDLDYIPASR